LHFLYLVMRNLSIQLCFLLLLPAIGFSQNYHQYVNPFIGTGGHGHTFPGATAPFGMVQLSPDTRIDGSWDGCSGYHYSDSVIYGFSHTHLNGTGVSDFGDIMLMPTMGEPNLNSKDYSSSFSHQYESAEAGYYSVKLDKYNIDVALTASTRVGMHQYTFNSAGQANIILDLNHRDHLLTGQVRIIDDKTIEVMRESEGWASDQYVFARIEFSRPVKINAVNNNAFAPAKFTDRTFAGSILALSFSTQVKKGQKLLVKVALSPTGFDGAKLNMSEIKGWDFAKVKQQTQKLWDTELSKIEVNEAVKDKLVVFYTALYHTMMQPNIAQDIDGKYRGRDNEIHIAKGFDYYTVFSLWDTFRAAHPLYTILDQKRTADFINTFLAQYEQGGRLPVWELASNETDCMIGYHSVSVMADAMAKGIKGFDYNKAFEAAKHSAMLDHLGLDAYKKNGFISIDDEHESVSKTLEYAYDDWCIAQMARLLSQTDDYRYFMKRSQSWKNIFDSTTGFMRPKKNGNWESPFDPREVSNNFTEGNSWQYSFFVPQDIPGLILAHGGPEKFEAKLDELFTAPTATTGREQVDITGLIGQYAHGNEPSHHMAYLYTHVGKPEKTQAKVDFILDNFYKNAPDGLIGNEDCGQMSAWYVLSSIGMYSIAPGTIQSPWTNIKPHFSKVVLHLEGGKTKVITASTPHFERLGSAAGQSPFHAIAYEQIIPVPLIKSSAKSFRDKMTIEILSANPRDKIFYMTMGPKDDFKMFEEYVGPFEIKSTCTILAYVSNGSRVSDRVNARFYKKPNNYTINIKSTYNKQYSAGGPDGLLDGIFGDENWRKGDWQGYQSQNFEAVVDLQKEQPIRSLSARFLQDSRSWILMPTKVEYYLSKDNVNFTLAKTIDNTVDAKSTNTQIIDFTTTINPQSARYVKLVAYNFGKLPEWHQGFGGDAFIFIDEIEINKP
jgi:predicted alpha-1,2-mannosidase